ncbi:MAG TPA: ABC transporter permease [Thermomicrobiales bacterium]|nr:ABC transporter permease [Thermomicrobiales bacterium]
MTRSTWLGRLVPLGSSLLAIVGAFVVGALFLAARGRDPLAAYDILFRRGLGTSYGITETLIRMAPLLIVSAGLLISLRAGVWNIGLDGQLLIGALLSAIAASALVGKAPNPVMWLVAALAGAVGGALWALAPGILKVRWGLNEIITTLMMNYVAINVTSWLVKGPVKDPAVVPPQTTLIPREARLPSIGDSGVHIGLIVGLIVALAVAVLFRYTVPGFMLDVLGRNRTAAIHAGMPVNRLTLAALLLSGAFAGLAGANDILGVKGLFQGNWNPGYGFAAFALVYLARLNSLWIIPFAYFLSFLSIGGEMMARPLNIPTYFVDILEGLMLIFFAVGVFLERLYLPAARLQEEMETGSASLEDPELPQAGGEPAAGPTLAATGDRP